MRKFKLFSYLLIAGMLFSNANMYAMEGQNQNLGNEENQTQEKEKPALAVIVSPFYDPSFKTIFPINSEIDPKNENLKELICEVFPNAIKDSDEIEVVNSEVDPGVPPHGKGKLIADIPFIVNTQDGKRVLYDVEMQQTKSNKNDIYTRLRSYGLHLQEKLQLTSNPITLVAFLGKGFDENDLLYRKLLDCDIKTGDPENGNGNPQNGNDDLVDKILLMPIVYFVNNDSCNGHELPSGGWCKILGYCLEKIGRELISDKPVDVVTIKDSWVVESPKGKKLVELLGTEGERGRKLAELIANNEAKAEEDMKKAIRQEGVKSELQRSIERDSEHPGLNLFDEDVAALKRRYQDDPEMQQFIEQIAKKLKLSAQKEQESESKQDESKSLPTSTK